MGGAQGVAHLLKASAPAVKHKLQQSKGESRERDLYGRHTRYAVQGSYVAAPGARVQKCVSGPRGSS